MTALCTRPTLPGHKQQGKRVFSPAQHLSGTWSWIWASAALCQPHLRRKKAQKAQDIPVTIIWQSEKMWGSNSNCSWDWGLSTAHRQMLEVGAGDVAWKEKKKQGRWLTMWLIIASDCGGSQFSYLAKWNKTRSQSSSSSDKVTVPMAPFRVSQSGPPTSQRFRGNV